MDGYDLDLVDHAPQPPHERTWRHPSELGPTKFDVDLGGRSPVGVLVVGAMAVLAVAALVVVATPRPGSGPLAISATTTPFVRSVAAAVEAARPPAPPQPTVGKLIGSYTAYPHAIAASSLAAVDGAGVAEETPTPNADVLVRTDKVTYRLQWSQVPQLAAPEGTVVFDLQGDVIARVIDGELRSLVDD
jgi:hypothetical protein